MDAKKKPPVKRISKKQFKNYAVLDGISVSDMTKEQLESCVHQLQQEVEKEKEERNYFQIERDKIQLFWEATKHRLEEKDAILQLKNSEIDEAALSHLAEIKLYKQKMKHILFECQQNISDTMKEKMGEKLMLEEEHHLQIHELEDRISQLKDEILLLKTDHDNAVTNQRLNHSEELCSLHQKYQEQIDNIKCTQVNEIGNMRKEFDRQRLQAILEVEESKDLHANHLTEVHEEFYQKMKNYYNDIIKNDILLIKSLEDQIQEKVKKESQYADTTKQLQLKNAELCASVNGSRKHGRHTNGNQNLVK